MWRSTQRQFSRRRTLAAGVGLLGAVTLAACTGSGGSGGSAGVDVQDAGGVAAPAASSAPSSARSAPLAGTQAGDAAPLATDVRIRTATLTVTVRGAERIAPRANAATDVAVQAGGEIDSDERTGGEDATASLRVRVPPDKLETVLDALSRLGHETSRNVSSTDVTEKVADVGSRVSSATAAISRLQTLYRDATKVSDVIAIEGELSSREADLESLQAQQRSLSRQTAMAAITLYLRARAPVATHHHPSHKSGFLAGLSSGWAAFVSAAKGVATAAGALLPFLAVLLVLLLAARLFGVRVAGLARRRPRPVPSGPPTPEPAE